MKSNKRLFIEKYTNPYLHIFPSEHDALEKELDAAIQSDNPEQFSREDMENAFKAGEALGEESERIHWASKLKNPDFHYWMEGYLARPKPPTIK